MTHLGALAVLALAAAPSPRWTAQETAKGIEAENGDLRKASGLLLAFHALQCGLARLSRSRALA